MIEDLKDKILGCSLLDGMPVRIVAIDGRSGSGKTTLANRLAKILDAEILHVDDFAFPNHQGRWILILRDTILNQIKNGAKVINYQPTKWSEKHNPKAAINQRVTQVMILEGVRSNHAELRPYIAFSIWIDVPVEISTKRGIERDINDPESDKDLSAFREKWEKWEREEAEYIIQQKPEEFADVIVGETDW